MIAAETGHQFVDAEAEFLIKDSDLFREFLQRGTRVVVQAPHMLKDVVDDPPEGVFIALHAPGPGPYSDASASRIRRAEEFGGNTTELKKFGSALKVTPPWSRMHYWVSPPRKVGTFPLRC